MPGDDTTSGEIAGTGLLAGTFLTDPDTPEIVKRVDDPNLFVDVEEYLVTKRALLAGEKPSTGGLIGLGMHLTSRVRFYGDTEFDGTPMEELRPIVADGILEFAYDEPESPADEDVA